MKDKDGDGYLVDKMLDTAQQKGTGKWMSQHALDLGVPLTLITEAVYARCLSAQKEARVRASKILSGPSGKYEGDPNQFVEDVRQALYASKLVSYAQGFVQLDAAADEFGWKLNNGEISLLWRGGCIIRSAFLGDIKKAFDKNPDLENLLLDDFFRKAIDTGPAELATRGRERREPGHSHAGVHFGPQLLRRLSTGASAGQSAAGAAGLLRRPHLQTDRQGRHLPHRLAARAETVIGEIRASNCALKGAASDDKACLTCGLSSSAQAGSIRPRSGTRRACCFRNSASCLTQGQGCSGLKSRLQTKSLCIFLSHSHLDHIVGLTYLLPPLYDGTIENATVYGSARTIDAVQQHLFAEEVFPVAVPIEFVEVSEQIDVPNGGRLSLRIQQHPGGSQGYRIDWPDRSLAYVTDTTADGGSIDFVREVDLLIHECTFRDDLRDLALQTGHSHTTPVCELARDAGVKRLVLTHFDPYAALDDPVDLPAGTINLYPH